MAVATIRKHGNVDTSMLLVILNILRGITYSETSTMHKYRLAFATQV